MARLSGPMPDGEYTLHWKTSDSEGEESEGAFTFTVKRGGGSS
jgi:methionine-rich copper-binding protein CopC